ncbi:hypothetical protein [Enterococcus rotai]|uniref:hypothetical protein n=1 Tax=Enterococcus rotai TaxID=118060 RepID=UPI0035C66A7A
MSEQEMVTGTIKLVAKKIDAEKVSKGILEEKGLLTSCSDSFVNTLTEKCYEEYVVISDDLYEVESKQLDPYEFFEIIKVADGEYNFAASFYNGGTCLSELLEKANLEESQ